ncbi:LD-carboxypeptidase [Sphingomonas sp. BK235]|jgi:muramoyltetrapeptide carboxypeptidase|uniref:LD-carboxypeptidase n=1 Tax=Sphingomonas sp. BK235 TaxID=2512131 RepID=UPI001049A850|nr:LD-carboxypeptidase [Sphingomonas sp. BK235]TCP33172.1 muramoyltetrapeptide carboxypeptidase [Sphingomonas sp. BK235]
MRIGVLAASSVANPDVIAPVSAFAAIAFPEIDLVFHPQCYAHEGHFAGSDAVRAAAFLDYANDPAFDAIWFLRGGYGSNRLLATIMPRLGEAARRKTYLGYSDVGFLLGALYARRIGHPVHGPMASDIRRTGGDATVARALGWFARRDRAGLEPGLDGRPAAAFNLSILTALVGTPYLPDLADHVLIVEEVSEAMYAIDRMLFTLGNATQLRSLAGVRLGAVTAVQENDPAWGETLEVMMRRWCGELGVPYLGRAEIGHTQSNRVVPFGVV